MKQLFSVAVVIFAVGHVFKPTVFDKSLLVLLLLAVSPWIIPFLARHLKSAEMFGAKVEFLEQKLKEQAERVDELFLASMGNKAFFQLEKFDSDRGFGPFQLSRPFESELSHLENLGYIVYKGPGVKGLDDLRRIQQGNNLSDYIELTENGKTFLDLRRKLGKTLGRLP